MALFGAAAVLAACSPSADFGGLPSGGHGLPVPPPPVASAQPGLPAAQGEVIGTGPVRVALLVPLSGQGGLAQAGTAMRNAARLALETASGSNQIHIVVKDTGGSAARAAQAAREAVAEGASLILGPLRADAVASAGAVARNANIPLIGFSNTSTVAAEGVYLLSVLPEVEIMRSLVHARGQGVTTLAALIPATDFGQAQEAALRQTAAETGITIRSIEVFSNEAGARQAVERIVPLLKAGQIDALFLPDRATAPSFGILLSAAEVSRTRLAVIGSADWEGDGAILSQNFLAGAIYPALDPAGFSALSAAYSPRFGGAPHPLARFAHSAVLAANSAVLAQSAPRYAAALLATPSGFSGHDGQFRFHYDGRGEYGLVMRQVQPGGAVTIDGVRLPGLTRQVPGLGGADAGIPPAAEYR